MNFERKSIKSQTNSTEAEILPEYRADVISVAIQDTSSVTALSYHTDPPRVRLSQNQSASYINLKSSAWDVGGSVTS